MLDNISILPIILIVLKKSFHLDKKTEEVEIMNINNLSKLPKVSKLHLNMNIAIIDHPLHSVFDFQFDLPQSNVKENVFDTCVDQSLNHYQKLALGLTKWGSQLLTDRPLRNFEISKANSGFSICETIKSIW